MRVLEYILPILGNLCKLAQDNDFSMAVHVKEAFTGFQLGQPLVNLVYDGLVGHGLHAAAVEDHAVGLVQCSVDVALNGTGISGLGRLHLPTLSVNQAVGRALVGVVALLDEVDIVACTLERHGRAELVVPYVHVIGDVDMSDFLSHGRNYSGGLLALSVTMEIE